ncbi:MAG TPA: Ig-like domain-containing protein, partial [Terriglobia bacterium]|nr:Ig-like domain-containing protein [Terriglobia bacterium]
TLTTSALAVGTHSITATYVGGVNFLPGTPAAISQVVNTAPTTTTVSSTPSPSVYGQSVTFTAVLNSAAGVGTATGSVKFMDGATSLGSSAVVVGGGYATLSVPNTTYPAALMAGTHSITAVYTSGDVNFTGSTSPVYAQVVNKASVSTTLTSSLNPSLSGQSVTFTAQVSVLAPGSGTPSGTVSFMDGTTTISTGTLNSAGWTILTTSALGTGTHSITAVYSGDANFAANTSSALSQTVN